MQILLTAGLGDIIVVEGSWDDEFRRNLTVIHWAAKVQSLLVPLIQSCPEYAHVEHRTAFCDWSRCRSIVHKEHLEKLTNQKLPHVIDYSSVTILHKLSYVSSAFLRHPVADLSPFDLPDRYIAVQGRTSLHFARKLNDYSWDNMSKLLEKEGCSGVVIGEGPVPDGPYIDLTGQTTLQESFEVVKGACGYVGVDSWASVLASKIFAGNRLQVVSTNSWLYGHAVNFYSPHTSFPWLTPGIRPEWRC